MRFGAFIESHLDAIVEEWKVFARTISPETLRMSELALQDHARGILLAVVRDMERGQTDGEGAEKSKGRAPVPFAQPDTAATLHGTERLESGFDLAQLASEFRALRASVLALWRDSAAERDGGVAEAIEEIARFNEGMDQALTESVVSYTARLAQSRDMFLAVLGHDVRGPLSGIGMAADLLSLPALSDAVRLQTAMRIRRAADTIGRLTTDLLEYARTRLGPEMPIERSDVDLRELVQRAVDAVEAAHPTQAIRLDAPGDLRTRCDLARIQQVLANLLHNAVQHGDATEPIRVELGRDGNDIVLAVRNGGRAIPADAFERIFQPMVQVPHAWDGAADHRNRVGLGLFIVRQIVTGHGGSVAVESSDGETAFVVRLPHVPPQTAA